MSEKASENTEESQAAYVKAVKALQDAVQESPRFGDAVKARVQEVNAQFCVNAQGKPQLNLTVRSEQTGDDRGPSLRVTCPSRSVVSAEIPSPLAPKYVEFYLTRPRADGLAETRLLGVTKYKDGDGKWNVTFTTERFARRPNDPLVIHAEALDEGGRLLAGCAVGVID
jgi:hypothetical protein